MNRLTSRKFLTWLIPVLLGFILVMLDKMSTKDWWMFAASFGSAYLSANLGCQNKSRSTPKLTGPTSTQD